MATLALSLALTAVPGRAVAQTGAATAPIIGGHAATEAEQRATVALVDPTGQVFCTGTLVTPKVVVTAAHCFYDEFGDRLYAPDVRVVVGLLDLTSPAPEAARRVVDAVFVHPDYPYNPAGDEAANGLDPTEADIAVVRLPEDVPGAATVPIAARADADAALRAGGRVELLGYGVTDLVTGDYGLLMAVPTSVLETTANEFLAGFAVAGDGDACFGDSGGPAYALVDGHEVLVGVTSRGRTDVSTDCGDGGIWTRADTYHRYVERVSGDPRVGAPAASGGCSVGPGSFTRSSSSPGGAGAPPGVAGFHSAWVLGTLGVAAARQRARRRGSRRA